MITCCRKAYRAGYILGIFGILGIPEALPRIGNRVESVYRARPAEASAPAFGRASRVFPPVPVGGRLQPRGDAMGRRSEEHTSELQSLMRISYAVFCLKKKNNNK